MVGLESELWQVIYSKLSRVQCSHVAHCMKAQIHGG